MQQSQKLNVIALVVVLLLGAAVGWTVYSQNRKLDAPIAVAPSDEKVTPARSSASPTVTKPISWGDKFDLASAQSVRENRVMMVDFGAEWCGWCKKLDATTFTDPRVIAAVSKYVCVKVDVDKDPETAQKFGASSLPSVVFVAPDGKSFAGFQGYVNADGMMGMLAEVEKRYKNKMENHSEKQTGR